MSNLQFQQDLIMDSLEDATYYFKFKYKQSSHANETINGVIHIIRITPNDKTSSEIGYMIKSVCDIWLDYYINFDTNLPIYAVTLSGSYTDKFINKDESLNMLKRDKKLLYRLCPCCSNWLSRNFHRISNDTHMKMHICRQLQIGYDEAHIGWDPHVYG